MQQALKGTVTVGLVTPRCPVAGQGAVAILNRPSDAWRHYGIGQAHVDGRPRAWMEFA